ncbi:uncharacterized protein LOC130820782 isoform X2 [Amaranthus tricolor]|uniref:uncharacterized protein LOC130820782 isoform X2 n=1 Tax=Amaranthus tricolor TaxID=29722 RepID=UPI0025868902|nr:uncharacterized protein LOC130820782 isoform X2 [Amaranthus tricolor]
MEDLLKQVRSKLTGKEEFGGSRERKKSSFKGERRPPNWIRRQFSRQMSYKEPSDEAEYAAAVAAAAFAITSLDSHNIDQTKPELGTHFSLPRIYSRIIDRATDEPSSAATDEYEPEARNMMPEKTIHPVPSPKQTPTQPKKRPTFADDIEADPGMSYDYRENDELENAKRSKPTNSFTGRSPSMRRNSSFGEAHMQNAKTKQEISAAEPILPSPIPPPPAVPPLNIQPIAPSERPSRPRDGKSDVESDADAWEREQLEKIKARYARLNNTIQEWEDKKKKKAKRKLETTEQTDHEKRRARAMQNYHIEMRRIKQIADGARAQAIDKRRNEELKVNAKAMRYRATGEPPLPPSCLCL